MSRSAREQMLLMDVDELLAIERLCDGCLVLDAGHDAEIPCRGAAQVEIISRARQRDEAILSSTTAAEALRDAARPLTICGWFAENNRQMSVVTINRYLLSRVAAIAPGLAR